MKEYNTVTLHYLHSKLAFFIEPTLSLDRVFDFFSTHFFIKKDQVDENVIANVYVTRDFSMFSEIDFDGGEEIYIRKSASDFFTIPGKRVFVEGIEYIKCVKTGTLIAFDSIKNKITISTKTTDTVQEELLFIELIRDLILKNEENHGVVVLHATSAYKDGKASLIIGSKGAGKSTTLLELVSKFDYQHMSGDKTFLWVENGQLLASGWPDYPHLGLGTLSKYPKFIERLGLAEKIKAAKDNLWSTEHKMAVDPKLFKEVIPFTKQGLVAPVGSMIYPHLYPTEQCDIKPISEHVDLMTPHIERIFIPGQKTWNHFIEPRNQAELEEMINKCLQAASKIPGYVIRGSGILENVQLLSNKGAVL
ncbi:hypothetical protein [Anoxybacillus sp. TBDG-1]